MFKSALESPLIAFSIAYMVPVIACWGGSIAVRSWTITNPNSQVFLCHIDANQEDTQGATCPHLDKSATPERPYVR